MFRPKKYVNKVIRQIYHQRFFSNLSISKLVYSGLLKSKLQYGISCTIKHLLIKQKHAVLIIICALIPNTMYLCQLLGKHIILVIILLPHHVFLNVYSLI